MKALVVSLIILTALTLGVFVCAHRAAESLDTLIEAVNELTPDGDAAEKGAREVRRAWRSAEKFYSLAIDRRELETIDLLLAAMEGAAKAGDREELIIIREQLSASLWQMRREVRPDFRHLF